MVASSKMRKAQDRMRAARPYAEKVGNIAANLAKANLANVEAKNAGFPFAKLPAAIIAGANLYQAIFVDVHAPAPSA